MSLPGKQITDLDFFEAASGVCERGDPGLDRLGLGAMRFLNCKGKHRNEAHEVFFGSAGAAELSVGTLSFTWLIPPEEL